jgi:predicted aspartyl protease
MALLSGPVGITRLRLALDTGATQTVVRAAILVSLGFDPALASERIRITTASGVEYAPKLTAPRLEALGCERCDFPILAHTLPPSATVDGLLGLDFFRGTHLSIDFRKGRVEVVSEESASA